MGVRIPGGRKPEGQPSLLDLVLPGLQDYVEDLPILGDLVEAITGREDGDPNDIGSMINKLKSWVGGLFGFRASISSQVKELQGLIATGAQFYDSMDRGDADGLGNGWTQGGDGQPLGIRDQAAQIIQGGVTATPGRRWAKSPQAASGDTFTISMVTHPIAPSQYGETWLLARMNAAFTEGLALRMVSGKCWLSRVSRPSSTSNAWSLTPIEQNLSRSYSKSATVEFKGEESVLEVSIDSVIVMTATDTVHAIDAAHRENGFAVQTTTAALGFAPSYSGGLASYSLKSVAALDTVVNTATTVAVAKVAPVASAVTAGASGAPLPVDADTVVYAATKTVSDTAKTAVQQSVTTAIIVQQQQQNQNAGAGGLNKVLTFASLSSTDWTYDPAVFSVANNQLVLSGNIPNGFWLIRPNYSFTTDSQAVFAQLGSEANNDQYTFLCLRATNGGAQGVACRVSANSIAIGTYSHNGSADGLTFNAAASVGRTNNTGDSIEFRAIGNNYAVLANGNSVLTFTGTLGTVGSSNRNAAVIKQKAQGAFGIVFYSFNLSSFGMYDFGAVGASATSRVNARISRLSNATVSFTLANGGFAAMPANYYSSTDSLVGMTVTDLNTGKIRVDTADWYEVEVSFMARYNSTGAGSGGDFWWGQAHFCLYVNDTLYTQGLLCGVPHRFQFAQNDVIQVGVACMTMGLRRSSGDASSDSSFSITSAAAINALGGGPGSFFQISKSYQ